MTRFGCGVWFLLLAASHPAQGQGTSGPHTLSLSVAIAASGGAGDASSGLKINPGGKPLGGGWTTATQKDYKQSRKEESAIGLDVEVHNVGHAGDAATLEWFFYSKDINGKKPEELFEHGSEPVSLTPGAFGKYSLRSSELTSSIVRKLHTDNGVNKLGMRNPPSASTHKSGSRVAGWIVRLVAEGKPLVVRAASPSLESQGVAPRRPAR